MENLSKFSKNFGTISRYQVVNHMRNWVKKTMVAPSNPRMQSRTSQRRWWSKDYDGPCIFQYIPKKKEKGGREVSFSVVYLPSFSLLFSVFTSCYFLIRSLSLKWVLKPIYNHFIVMMDFNPISQSPLRVPFLVEINLGLHFDENAKYHIFIP